MGEEASWVVLDDPSWEWINITAQMGSEGGSEKESERLCEGKLRGE